MVVLRLGQLGELAISLVERENKKARDLVLIQLLNMAGKNVMGIQLNHRIVIHIIVQVSCYTTQLYLYNLLSNE